MIYFAKNFYVIFLFTILSCSGNSGSFNYASEEGVSNLAEAEYLDQATEPTSEPIDQIERKLITEGRVSFETSDIETSRAKILQAVNKYKAYISSDEEFNYSEELRNTITVRIPSENFDYFLSEATKGVEKFESKEINVRDVTEEFLDVQARLKTKKELETRYLELLKKADSVSDMLEIERQIGQLRSEIESIEGRLNYLQNRVSFSTLTLTLIQRSAKENEFGKKFKNGFVNGWNNFIYFFVVLTNIWPFIMVLVGMVYGIIWYSKKKKKS